MPWNSDLFSEPARRRMLDERGSALPSAASYFAGLMAGEPQALTGSFAGQPEVHDPVRGRVRGSAAFEAFARHTAAWLQERHATTEIVNLLTTERRSVEEVVLRHDTPSGRVALPVAIVADHEPAGSLHELRVYHSSWPSAGRHAIRPPVLQPDPSVHGSDVIGDYQRALASGDARAIVSLFEPDGYAREPAGEEYVHRGHDGLRAFYELLFSHGGGIPLEHCTATDDGGACAIEYNVVRWGSAELAPQAGVAVYVRGEPGRLAAARIYDDTDPPLGSSG